MSALLNRLRFVSIPVLAAGLIALIGLGLISSGLTSVQAGPTSARITVHAFWCEAEGEHLFPECHRWDRNAIDNAEFTLAGATRWTLNGYVSWSPSAGEHTIQGANAIRYRGVTVICTNQVTGMILHAGAVEEDRVTITTTAGQELICDWYYHYGR